YSRPPIRAPSRRFFLSLQCASSHRSPPSFPTRRSSDLGESRATYLRNPDVRLGKAGVEAELEPALHGKAGWRKVIVNAFGREMGEDEHERREPTRDRKSVV